MKKAKWITMILVVVSIILCAIGCAKETVPPHEHTFATEWTKNETHHWHAATCEHTSEVSEKASHSFGKCKVVIEATEETKGIKERSCSVCGYKETAEIEKLEHKHTFSEYVSNNDATQTSFGTKTRKCSTCGYKDTVTDKKVPEMVEVKGGTIVGALPAYIPEENAHIVYNGVFVEGRTVTLSDFYMGKYEVTQEEYASVMKGQKVTVNGKEYELESNPNFCTKDSTKYTLFKGEIQEKRPVEGVSWYDAVWYCNALSEKEVLTPAYNIVVTEVEQVSGKTGYSIYEATVTLDENATGYRLPTEAEWEYAARGGDQTQPDWNYTFSGADTAAGLKFYESKNSGLDTVGWYCHNNITGETEDIDVTGNVEGCGTHEVGKKAANRLGIYDMSGNVSEWCYDLFGSIESGFSSRRVLRSGDWFSESEYCLVSYRYDAYPYERSSFFGFRVVRPSSRD